MEIEETSDENEELNSNYYTETEAHKTQQPQTEEETEQKLQGESTEDKESGEAEKLMTEDELETMNERNTEEQGEQEDDEKNEEAGVKLHVFSLLSLLNKVYNN